MTNNLFNGLQVVSGEVKTNLHKLSISIIMSLGVFCILTLPHFIAFQTMDINNGHYRGYVYPLWLMMLIAIGSGFLGKLIVNKFKNK